MKKKTIVYSVVPVLLVLFVLLAGWWLIRLKLHAIQDASRGVDRMAVNGNGYLLYMIEGTIERVYGTTPLRLRVDVDAAKIFPDQKNATSIPMAVAATADTQFVSHEVKTGKDSAATAASFQAGDNVIVWTVESNENIRDLVWRNFGAFTATKIIRDLR